MGFAALPAPRWFRPAGRPLAAVRVEVEASVQKWGKPTSQGIPPLVPSRAERDACTAYTREHREPILRSVLPTIRVERKA